MKKIIYILLLISISATSQTFSGFNAWRKLIEFEGQRYLMSEVYNISKDSSSTLQIEKTIQEYDQNEGFMFVLTSYVFNGKTGVVITAFNSISLDNSHARFVNIHLSSAQFSSLNSQIEILKSNSSSGGPMGQKKKEERVLKRFNDRIIIDVLNQGDGFYKYSIWIDTYSRHTFGDAKWEKAFKKHKRFISK